MDLLIDVMLKGLLLLHLTFWLLRHVFHRQGSLPQSVRCWQGQLYHLQQKFTNSFRKNGLVGMLKRVNQTLPFFP